MGMTITEKILAAHAGLDKVQAGDLITAKVDVVLSNDVTAPVAIREFEKLGVGKVFDNYKVVMVPDHFNPCKDIKSAEQCKIMRDFARDQELENYFEVGKMGIEHCLLPEQGLVGPGNLVIGADSHTCTYGALGAFSTGVGSTDVAAAMATGEVWLRVPESIKVVLKGKPGKWVVGKDVVLALIGKIGVDGARYQALEFTGDGLEHLSMDSRFSIANMAIEAGAKNGIIAVDEKTKEYIENRLKRPCTVYESDADASYVREIEIDLSTLKPQVAFPHLPSNTKDIDDVGEVKIDQVVIGSCTNGRMEDLRTAAAVLKGKKVAPFIRLVVFPGTQDIYQQCIEEGLIQTIIEAGGAVSTPTCGPCLGGHMGILAKGERAIATTNRNFVGRMGHVESEVYLSNPAVAAASAITGKISSPEEV
ncbi:3-isopropylmalate dehydratase, large subunit [Desulfonispora thiosulfatigenes DSM 11270]|uniref:3-isopropylmalate dehydratase large subunit n=1 Tax=Desulfonispora thiosulfatigenes DSM 11270 TaxID=656914 RepID=A0A1W1VE93_DESTI|nr:3-isopropylmalate dehydratase large subunit [Desulfonispora thiosulfatigenes]SMB91767.1 3-isopropylmalate dehydratase, large subunit [Desulfonispora thiosulfatigenes DSM 11270]